ncbi:MAG TPA: hypothetical protein VLJ15_00950 [Gammaproteobacteria bacterium]|nr:hypothetical protein [Gammaproteobacteria bacterium]
MFYKILLSIVLLFVFQTTFAESPFYFLCGPDEDGCPEGQEQYCACIPASASPEQPYCLNFDARTCAPLIRQPNCARDLIFSNQETCLATIFQSEPEPPCVKVSQSFCSTHSTYVCNEQGDPDSCKKPTP